MELFSDSDVPFEQTNKATSTRWWVIIATWARAQSSATATFDLGQGVAVKKLNVVVVKAAVDHRAAYDPITAHSLTADTTGLCSSNLKRLPYQHPASLREHYLFAILAQLSRRPTIRLKTGLSGTVSLASGVK